LLVKAQSVARSHKVAQSPWWFSAAPKAEPGGGRFDLSHPSGTCYVADTIEVATRERLRETILTARLVSPGFADSFAVSTFAAPRQYLCANIEADDAADFGVTRELAALAPKYYSISRTWANAFAEASFEGIRYGARFTPGQANSWALFGKRGYGEPPMPSDIKQVSGRDACKLIGVAVDSHPRLGSLVVLDT